MRHFMRKNGGFLGLMRYRDNLEQRIVKDSVKEITDQPRANCKSGDGVDLLGDSPAFLAILI